MGDRSHRLAADAEALDGIVGRLSAGQPGYTGETPQDRARIAGYPDMVQECSHARGGTALQIVAGHVVDAGPPGEGTGGMQERRGHRRCMIDVRWREVGGGLFGWGAGLWSNVGLYGAGGRGRILGGVVIEDRDGDEFYDVGEGIGGVHFAAGDWSALSCASGAWRLDLPDDARPRRLVAGLGCVEVARPLAAAGDVLVDLHLQVGSTIAQLEAELAGLAENAAARRRALQLLGLRARAVTGAKGRERRVAKAAGEIQRRLVDVRAPALWRALARLRHELVAQE